MFKISLILTLTFALTFAVFNTPAFAQGKEIQIIDKNTADIIIEKREADILPLTGVADCNYIIDYASSKEVIGSIELYNLRDLCFEEKFGQVSLILNSLF